MKIDAQMRFTYWINGKLFFGIILHLLNLMASRKDISAEAASKNGEEGGKNVIFSYENDSQTELTY